MEYNPKRKRNRIEGFDYSLPGRYFITFCTKDREKFLGTIPFVEDLTNACVVLSKVGELTLDAILSISSSYPTVRVDRYVIMPDHVHLLIRLQEGSTSVSRIVSQTKRKVSLAAGQSIWQSGYYDHIIRNERDYDETIQYIENNVKKRIIENRI